jgi:hypothetical protein
MWHMAASSRSGSFQPRRIFLGKWLTVIIAAYGLSVITLFAEDPGTNDLSAIYLAPALEFDDSPTSKDWGTRFGHELLKNQNILFDRLGPLSGYDFWRQTQFRNYGIQDEIGVMGRDAVERALQNSAQETALALLPVDEWMEILPLEKWQDFGTRLFKGSFGNTAEQELGDLSPTYSANESWWREAGHDGTLRYGIRPRTAPYLYASSNIGHVDDRPALALETRVRYIPFNRIETSFTAAVALPNSFELIFSALCEPMQASRSTAFAFRLQRVVGTGPSACAVFIGALHSAGERSILFGFAKPW